MNGTITYVSTVADDRYATRIAIAPTGAAHLTIGSNRDRRGRPVGVFDAMLPPALTQRVAAATNDPAFASVSSQPSLVPDESYRRIEVERAGGDALDKIFGEQLAAPPAFVNAERAIEEAIAQVMQSPASALTVQISGVPSTVRAGTSFELTLRVDNPSGTPLRIAAPAHWGSEVVATLNAVRDAGSPDNFQPTDQRFVNLDRAFLTGTSAAVRDQRVTIAPNERALIWFRLPVDWLPGHYLLEATVEASVLDANGRPAFEGALFSEPVRLEVQAR